MAVMHVQMQQTYGPISLWVYPISLCFCDCE